MGTLKEGKHPEKIDYNQVNIEPSEISQEISALQKGPAVTHNIQNAPREVRPTASAPRPAPAQPTRPSVQPGTDRFERQSDDLQALAELVATLQDRIAALEKRVGVLVEEETFAPVPLGQLARSGGAVWQGAAPGPVPATPPAAATPPQAPATSQPAVPATRKPDASVQPVPATQTYTVRPGDTLWSIAARQLGDPLRYTEIVQANAKRHPHLADSPDYLKPGWKLELPVGTPPARPPEPPAQVKPAPAKPAPQKPGATKPTKPGAEKPGATKPKPEKPTAPKPTKPVPEKPVAEAPKPVPPAEPAAPPVTVKPPAPEPEKPSGPSEATLKLRGELDLYLKENTNSGAVVALVKDHPEYVEAATPQQKSALVRQAIKPLFTDKKDRAAALRVLEIAARQGELAAVLTEIQGKKKLHSVFNTLGGTEQGRALMTLMQAHDTLQKAEVVAAMNSASVSDLLTTLGWKHPMIGTSDALKALPEAHKRAMIEKLVSGDFTQTDHRQAAWLNRHLEQPLRLPDYDPNRMR